MACCKAAPAKRRKLPCKSNDLLSDFSKGERPVGKGVHFWTACKAVVVVVVDPRCTVDVDLVVEKALPSRTTTAQTMDTRHRVEYRVMMIMIRIMMIDYASRTSSRVRVRRGRLFALSSSSSSMVEKNRVAFAFRQRSFFGSVRTMTSFCETNPHLCYRYIGSD